MNSTNSSKVLSVYVTEEQEFYRHLYQSTIESVNNFKFLGISANADAELLKPILLNETPNVLVMGFKRFTSANYAELEQINSRFPHISFVILMTAIGNDESILLRKLIQKCRKGIAVYMKQSLDNISQLHEMINSVHSGHVILDPTVTGFMLSEKTEYPFMKALTDRELEILNLLAQGLTNSGIAQSLCIDVKTVAHHLNNIYSKLKEDDEISEKHPRVSVARLYLETTGELMPFSAKNSISVFPS